jgi:hypothetical protein
LLREILKKEGKTHKDTFGKDFLPQVSGHQSSVSMNIRIWDMTVGIAIGCGLDNREVGLRVPVG